MAVTVDTRAPWSQLRLRQSAHLRDLMGETTFSVAQLIQPLFVVEGLHGAEPIPGLGENVRHGDDAALDRIARDLDAGVRHFLLFAVPASKRRARLCASITLGRAVAAIKARFGDALHLWVDICLCSSTEHGHCALLDHDGRHRSRSARSTRSRPWRVEVADAGADGVSPSDMMDGRTAHLRAALDDAGHQRVPIMSYSTKFASQFYGPFREAAGFGAAVRRSPALSDRRAIARAMRSRRASVARARARTC